MLFHKGVCCVTVKKEKLISKNDFLLLAVILLIAIVGMLVSSHLTKRPGESVRITKNGLLYGEYSLGDYQEVMITQGEDCNKVVIKDGLVWMEEANCPDKYCVEHSAISEENQTIICLPHRLVVEIIGYSDKESVDGYTR